MATKQLARRLGLVRTRSAHGRAGLAAPSRQRFRYAVVMDFESTCWSGGTIRYSPEIIEFPAVLLNTLNGEIESEFHTYVQPQEHPVLSKFCTELTGITQVSSLYSTSQGGYIAANQVCDLNLVYSGTGT